MTDRESQRKKRWVHAAFNELNRGWDHYACKLGAIGKSMRRDWLYIAIRLKRNGLKRWASFKCRAVYMLYGRRNNYLADLCSVEGVYTNIIKLAAFGKRNFFKIDVIHKRAIWYVCYRTGNIYLRKSGLIIDVFHFTDRFFAMHTVIISGRKNYRVAVTGILT